MQQYKEFLYDELGNSYNRKNLFLVEYIELQKKLNSCVNTEETNKIKNLMKQLNKNKNNHPYIGKLNDFKNKENKFKRNLKESKEKYKEKLLNEKTPKKVLKYKLMLFEAQHKFNFYKDYTELSYDAQFKYKDSQVIKEQIGEIINNLEINIKNLNDILENKSDLLNNVDYKFSYTLYKKKHKEILKNKIHLLKGKYKDGIISKKAYKNQYNLSKIEYKSKISSGKCNKLEEFKKQLIRQYKYEISKVSKRKYKILNENRNNVRKVIPIEIEKTTPYNAYLGLFFPGVGQLLNKQYVKSILFFLGLIFIYFFAIPYSLGAGNYQGNGLFGLVNLAKGTARTHKSIIYMIEGIIAICLLVVSTMIFIFSFKDSLKVEKEEIRGIRHKTWFETKSNIGEKGFPYLVSLPSLIVIIFIVIVPIATSIMLSFTNMDPQHQGKFQWIGLENYINIVKGNGMIGSVFWNIFTWTIVWTLVATILAIVVGFALALIVNNERIKGKRF